jgi:biopolymer transport protein ExbD
VVTQKFILNEQDLEVKVPTADTTSEDPRAIDEMIINAREDKDGTLIVTIDRTQFTLEELQNKLSRQVRINKHQPVRIRGDADMRWQKVADVISTCTKAGVYNVSFSKQMPQTSE